jgi:hypothetical protein
MSDDNTIDLRKFNNNLADPNYVLNKITSLEKRIRVMRELLWEWNPSAVPVWEHYKLQNAGETSEDYNFINEDPDFIDEYKPYEPPDVEYPEF